MNFHVIPLCWEISMPMFEAAREGSTIANSLLAAFPILFDRL